MNLCMNPLSNSLAVREMILRTVYKIMERRRKQYKENGEGLEVRKQ